MANARASSLAARRGTTKIRILAPVATGISSIAKQNAANETDIMIAKYNAGQIGNEEMKSFFQTQLNNPYVSASDKTQIQTKLLDFDVLIEKDRLESVFKQAPENSIQKAQAATALADFYNRRASTMVPGTQAHSQALENAGAWQAQVASIQGSVNKQQRKNLQYSLLQKINQLPNSSSDKAQARADMYKQLYDMAVSQGDKEDASVYAANAQQELSNVTAYKETEANKAVKDERSQVVNFLNESLNAYHDGKIDANQLYQVFQQVDQWAVANNDGVLQNKVNSETDRVAKIEAKGGLNRSTVGGLPVVLKGSGSGGGTITDWDQKAYDYSDNIRLAQELLKAGKDGSGKPYTMDNFQQDISQSIKEYATALTDEIASMELIAQTNPNQKVYFEGKKQRVADVVDQLYKNQDDIAGQVDALNNGTAAIMEIPPKQSATNPNGKPITTYAFVDTNNIDPNITVADTSGVLHQIIKETVPMTPEQIAQVYNNQFIDPTTGTYHKVKVDSAGNYFMETGKQLVDTYEPGGTKKITLPLEKDASGNSVPFAPFNVHQYDININGQRAMTNQELANMEVKKKKLQAQQEVVTPSIQGIQPTKPSLQPPMVQKASTVQASPTAALQEGDLGKAINSTIDTTGQKLQDINKTVIQPTVAKVTPTIQKVASVVTNPSLSSAPIPYLANKVSQAITPTIQSFQQTAQKSAATPLSPQIQKVVNTGPIGTILKASLGVQNTIKNTATNAWNWLMGKK